MLLSVPKVVGPAVVLTVIGRWIVYGPLMTTAAVLPAELVMVTNPVPRAALAPATSVPPLTVVPPP